MAEDQISTEEEKALKKLERKRSYSRKYYREHREYFLKYVRIWQKANPDKFRKALRKYAGLPEPTREMPKFCECCGGSANGSSAHTGTLHLDHCHTTGRFRGWLCSGCNTAIGTLGDNLEGLMKAVAYLQACARY